MENEENKPENYIELTYTEKQSTSKEGNRGWDRQTKVKVTDATEKEMNEKLCVAAKILLKSKQIMGHSEPMKLIKQMEAEK